jgi:hypothetical protein
MLDFGAHCVLRAILYQSCSNTTHLLVGGPVRLLTVLLKALYQVPSRAFFLQPTLSPDMTDEQLEALQNVIVGQMASFQEFLAL